MADNKIKTIIVVSEDGMFTNVPCPVDKMANIFLAALTAAVEQIDGQLKEAVEKKEITEKDREVARKDLFDGLNGAYSKQLELAFPDFELRPEVTEEVMKKILKAEDNVINHRAVAAKKKNKSK